MRAGGATAAANAKVPDRLFKRHGRWRSESAKDGYVKDNIESRLKVSQSLGLYLNIATNAFFVPSRVNNYYSQPSVVAQSKELYSGCMVCGMVCCGRVICLQLNSLYDGFFVAELCTR